MNARRKDAAALLALLEAAATPAELSALLLRPAEQRLLRRCALARRFDRRLLDEVLRPDAQVDSKDVSFERLTSLPGVRAEPGRPGWYGMDAAERAAHESVWRAAPGAPSSDETLGEQKFRALNHRIAQWFAALGAEGEIEALYNGLAADDETAKRALQARFDEAAERFDLARCEALLDILDQRQRLRSLDPKLANFHTNALGLLRARNAVADDYFRTARYLERSALLTAFETMLHDPSRFILHLHGTGGRGKTMFLRWLAARYCLPKNIPIARVDFDYLDASEVGLEPRFFCGKFAERLNLQLPGGPFLELLDVVREMRQVATARLSGRQTARTQTSQLEEAEIATRFADVLEENWHGPVVLVFDTLEDAEFKHHVDVFGIVRAIDQARTRMHARAATFKRKPPHLVLILAGRYPLAEQYPELHTKYDASIKVQEVTPFDADESLRYLTGEAYRGLPDSPALAAVVRRAQGNPFKLALYADVLQVQPSISADDIERHANIDLLYLIERVLKRLPHYPLRWVLRYGVIAQSLTRRFLEEVLGPHLERAMRGDKRYDDPAIDDVKDAGWPALWYEQDRSSRLGKPDFNDLWKRLSSYASATSWVTSDGGVLVIQPVVSHPMRRVLREKPVLRRIHQDALRVLRARLKSGEFSSEDLAALTYHEFQLLGAPAATIWKRRLGEHSGNAREIRALASVVLSEDLRETEAGATAERAGLITPEIEARALFALANASCLQAREESGEEEQRLYDDARSRLEAYDRKRPQITERVVPLISEAVLRWEIAAEPKAREIAIAQLTEAEKTRLSAVDRAQLLLTLERAFSTHEPTRAEAYARKSAQLAHRRGDASAFAEAVHSVIYYVSARDQHAAALRECREAQAALSAQGRRWTSRAEALEERRGLRLRQAPLENQCGLASRALRHMPNPRPSQGEAGISELARNLLERAWLMVASDDPLGARAAAHEAAEAIDARRRTKQSGRSVHQMQVLRLRCMSTEAHALRRLMDFGSALDLFQTAHVQAVELGEHEHEARLRLSRARVHLHHLGDLRQGAELVGDRDDALADASPELRLDHLILRMWLHDRLKNASEVHRLAAAAGRLFPEITLFAASNRLELAIALLALTCIDKRTEALSLLHSSLLVFDSATVRLAQLRGLRYCRPVEEVPAEISDELTRLTRLPPANDKSHDRLTPPDRLRLQLAQIDLLRVIGDSDQAQAELVGLRAALRRARCPLQDRNVALMCDRLDLAPEDVLPPDWLSGFRATYARYPTLCGAALLDEATRQLGRASAVQARDLANESQKLLQHRGAVPSILDALLFRLQGNLARELGKAQEGSELEARAGQIFSELGHPAEAQTGESLLDARREAWSGQLAGTDGFGVRVDSPKQLTLLSWSLERPDVGSTPRPLTPPLRDLLSNLGGHPLGGSASLPLIEMLSADWLPLGLLLAEAILPPSLRSAVAARLSLGTAQEDEPLDLVLASANHLVHAVPWELTAVDETAPRPVVLEPRLHHMWRTKSNTLPQSRIAFAQRAMSTILERPLTADGRPGRATTKAVREAQRHLNIPATGRLDLPTWRAIRDHYRSFYVSAARQKGPVLLVQTEARFEIQAQRGHASLGTDLASLYVDHGFSVDVLDEPDPGQLLAMLGRKTYQVLHLAAPIAETRSSSELFLRLGAESTRLRSATVFSTSLLAKQLRAARPAAPLVIVDVPRPASVTESLRQLVLRNVFAAQLFAFASLPVVLATGLGEPDEQWMLSERLVLGLAERLEPGDLAQVLRRTEVLPGGLPPVPSLDAVLATACVALFARDPELHPWDLAHGEAP